MRGISGRRRGHGELLRAFVFVASCILALPVANAQLTTLRVKDYTAMPQTGAVDFPSDTANSAYLARVNFLGEEPGGASRFFVNDLNGPLYILDKQTKQFSTYLNFNGRGGLPGMFDEFAYTSGFANGLITFQFDPDYRNNGKFYTVHMEEPGVFSGSPHIPNNSSVPGLNTSGYAVTPTFDAPGSTTRQTVLIEWRDTNINNNMFEGTARELMRLDMVGQIHPMGDLIFNPLAQPGHADWRVMYISVGDGGGGENTGMDPAVRRTPQRLDTVNGKILRIVPDLNEHVSTSTVSSNGAYRIPNNNPFTSISNSAVRDEIFANGLRNPHRMSWDPVSNKLIVNDIGLNTWEEVNIIYAGKNYGYSDREGNEVLITNSSTGPLPVDDTIPVRITSTTLNGTITPTYPVALYGHSFSKSALIGDSITSGYVYRGSKIPALYGKYLFGDITSGQLFYCDYAEMLAVDDGNPSTVATIHTLNVLWDNPNRVGGDQLYTTITSSGVRGPLFQIIEEAYEDRGGQDPNLPGGADVTAGNGRADYRIQIDEAGELYIVSKSDGFIRALVHPGDYTGVLGDFNFDGTFTNRDIQGMLNALADLDDFKSDHILADADLVAMGDFNHDTLFTSGDIRGMLQVLAGGSIQAVPEPTTLALAALGLVGICGARLRLRK
jgi:hypothetical protein